MVGMGPVEPAVRIDIVIMTSEMDIRYFMRIRNGGLDDNTFVDGCLVMI